MEVILLERVARLGTTGDVVKVRDGFARNFLIPMKKALRATATNKKTFEEKREHFEAQNAEAKAAAEAQAKTLDGISVFIVRQASEEGKLYGSISVRDIADALAANGKKIERTAIVLNIAIKTLGVHSVVLQLHGEVTANVNVNVVRTEAEAAA